MKIKLNSGAVALALAAVLVFSAGAVFRGWLTPAVVRTASAAGLDDTSRTISVSGTGEIEIEPNLAYVTVGVMIEASTAGEAQRKCNEAAQATINAIKGLGIKDADIQTTGLSLYPVYDYSEKSGPQLEPMGFRAEHRITVTVRDLTKLGAVIDEAVGAGANTVNEISFGIEESDDLREQVLAEAVHEARSKADAIAKALGVRVVEIKSVQESGVDFGVYRAPYMLEGKGGGAPTPVMPGEITVRAYVTMVVRF